jgi:ubiquinone/menaquinone biosynthesis C-methylase UbiE
MKNSKKKKDFQLIPDKILKDELLYLTATHKGGLDSTKELAKLCKIKKGDYVLDVGCGIGTSSFFLAKNFNCKVVGIEINEKKIQWAKKNVKKEKLQDMVTFKIADAQNLPFNDETFDVVITEAVNVFIKDKLKAINEYKRVVKSGGYIGLHEGAWIKKPTKKIVDLFIETNKSVYNAGFQGYDYWFNKFTIEGWKKLLEEVGLKVTLTKQYLPPNYTKFDLIKDYGIKHLIKIILLKIVSRKFRKMINIKPPKEISEYYSSGFYISKKI